VKAEIEVGAMSNVVPDLLRQAFEILRRTMDVIAGAELEIVEVPLRIHCSKCDGDFELRRFVFACPDCESTSLDVLSGEDLLLRNVELEIEEKIG
jgi:hydrogenase nickel incorporation protein HypA/HybF